MTALLGGREIRRQPPATTRRVLVQIPVETIAVTPIGPVTAIELLDWSIDGSSMRALTSHPATSSPTVE